MSSMLRQNHVKIQDLVSYLRGYDPSKPQSAEEWSKTESSGFEPGMLIFCLERVSAPSGLALGKKESEGESFRVKDLCVVVGRDDNRSLVVNITASAFELRYLEVLLLEKARKAILDGKDFLYVTVKPSQPLDDTKLRELEELGANYAQGGSRRSLVGEGGGPQEPALALLAALGVRLSVGGIGKQVLDIGTVCHMIFAPDGRAEDRNKAVVRSCFTPMPNNIPIGTNSPQTAQHTPPTPLPKPVPQAMEWGPPPTTSWAQDVPPAAPSWSLDHAGEGAWAQEPAPPSAWSTDAPATPKPLAPPDNNQWFQTPPLPDTGFGVDSSGLNPFAPPSAPGAQPASQAAASAPPEPQPDYAAQFSRDLAEGLAGEEAVKYGENEFAQEQSLKWGEETPREFSQDEYAQKFSAPPELGQLQTAPPLEEFQAPQDEFQAPQFQKTDFSTSHNFHDFTQQPPEPSTYGGTVETSSRELDWGAGPELPPGQPPLEAGWAPPASILDASSSMLQASSLPPSEQLWSEGERNWSGEPASSTEQWGQQQLEATPPPPPVSQQWLAPQDEPQPWPISAPLELPPPQPWAPPAEAHTQPPSEPTWATQPATDAAWNVPTAPEAWPTPATQEEVRWAPQGGLSRTTTSSENGTLGDDVFQPPYEGAQDTDNLTLPAELTQQLDPKNQLFQAETETPADENALSGAAIGEPPMPPLTVPFERSSWASSSLASEAQLPMISEEAANEPIDNALNSLAGIGTPEVVGEDGGPTLFERLNNQLQKPQEAQAGPLNPEATHRLELSSENLAMLDQAARLGAEPPAPLSDAPPKLQPGFSTRSNAEVMDWASEPPEAEAADPYANLAEALAGQATEPPSQVPLLASETTLRLHLPAGVSPEDTLRIQSPFLQQEVVSEGSSPQAPVSGTEASAPEPFLSASVAFDSIGEPNPPAPSEFAVPPSSVANADEEAAQAPTLEASDFSPPADAAAMSPSSAASQAQEVDSSPAPEKTEPPQAAAVAPNSSSSSFSNSTNFQAAGSSDTATLNLEPAILPPPPPVPENASESGEFAAVPSFLMTDSVQTAAVTPEVAAEPALVPAAETAPVEPEEEGEEEDPTPAPARKGFQEPRLVMNEMATLMSKLEQQVQKAAKKLGSRSEDVRQRLSKQFDALSDEAADVEKDNQKSISNLNQKLTKQLDDVSEEVRLKISDVAANGRYTIKQLLTTNQNNVDETKNSLYESLRDSCKAFRVETEQLVKKTETELNDLVRERTDELQALVNAISNSLDESSDDSNTKLAARFDRFKERMAEEASSVIKALDRNVKSMIEEIEGSWDRASEKLKSSRSDFEQTINHTVKTAELNLSNKTRLILTNSFVPKLVESKNRLHTRSLELSKRFSEETEGQASSQILGLEASLAAAREQLQALVDECMGSLDTVGRGQQAGLEEIFKETSTHAEKATASVSELLKQIETEMNENDAACKKLAETSSIDTDPDLSEARLSTTGRVQQLKQHANQQLTAAIDDGCNKLEQLSQKVQTETNNVWQEQAQSVRQAAENGVTRMRDAIQEAFNAIQAAREKYME